MNKRFMIVDDLPLPYGTRGIIMKAECRNGVNHGHSRLVKKYGMEGADVNLATSWYTAYVVIPPEICDGLGWKSMDAQSYDIPVHGGCTYARIGWLGGVRIPEDWLVLGWDYAHYGDTMAEFDLEKVRDELTEFGEYIRMKIQTHQR